eukprot:5683856-Prymnesium_polylepis.1
MTLGHGTRGPGRTPPSRWAKPCTRRPPLAVYHTHFSLHSPLPPRPAQAHTQNVVRCGGG